MSNSQSESQPASTLGTTPETTPDHASTTLQPHHKLGLRTQVGALTFDLHLNLTAPWTVIYGPSGSGKTSILRALAGLLPNAQLTRQNPQQNPQDLTHLPPRDRHIAYAPQQPSLFPHLTVAANILFAQTTNNLSTSSEQNINTILKLFHLENLAHRYPQNLSGGEKQRVNLARAFAVPNQQLMLLDEPFTGIGRTLRDELLPSMRHWTTIHKIPVLSVTHDIEEVFLLHAEVIRLEEGRIQAQGAAPEVLAFERQSLINNLNPRS